MRGSVTADMVLRMRRGFSTIASEARIATAAPSDI